MSDARQRFVEAIKHMIKDRNHWALFSADGGCCRTNLEVAVHAFSDSLCAGQDWPTQESPDEHAACRAALEKEVFG